MKNFLLIIGVLFASIANAQTKNERELVADETFFKVGEKTVTITTSNITIQKKVEALPWKSQSRSKKKDRRTNEEYTEFRFSFEQGKENELRIFFRNL